MEEEHSAAYQVPPLGVCIYTPPSQHESLQFKLSMHHGDIPQLL